ncbi:unnamed protein product [Rhizophagus irregularis]|nr:unnamed protein product [Rhizophagus irregularis]
MTPIPQYLMMTQSHKINAKLDKHGITKDNYLEYLDESEENVQPLYILQNQAFQDLLLTCESGYKIPCDNSIKNVLYSAYTWSKEQLQFLLRNTVVAVHLTTNLWTFKFQHSYICITATWLTSDFEFQEALLSCNHLSYPHTSEVICDELFQILENWDLTTTAFIIATDNGMNMVKAVRLLRENYLEQI